MKKSTLITTIAMIVVVVVALSTATYAWFTSSTTAVASTTFSTQAAGEWSMIVGQVDMGDGSEAPSVAFTSSTVDTATLDASAINVGLWAPTAEISASLADFTASTTIANAAGFVQGSKKDSDAIVTKLQTAAFNSANEGQAGYGLVAPFALRVINTSGAPKTLQLNITLNAHNEPTNNTMYAAAAVRFYVYEFSNAGENGTAATYTSGYGVATKKSGFEVGETLDDITTIKNNTTDRVVSKTAIPMTNGANGLFNNMADYTKANIATEFPDAKSADANLGIAVGDHVRTYSFNMQNYAAGGYSNILIYAWIDGWVADNAAGAATNLSVNFGFKSASTGSGSGI